MKLSEIIQKVIILEAVQSLTTVMEYRHQIGHGVNPRPILLNAFSSKLPTFFQRLGRCTDDAMRGHLVDELGIVEPWPA